MFLNNQCLPRQFLRILVAQAETRAICGHDIHRLDPAAGGRTAGVDHLRRLGTEIATDDRPLAGAQCGLVDIDFVGIDRALHHHFAESPGCGDEHDIPESRLGVEREHDTACAEVAPDHVLHANGERDGAVIEALVHAVGDGAVVVERGIDLMHRSQHGLSTAHIQDRLLLAGK